MSHLQIIEKLSALVEEQSSLIRHLSMELAHARELTEAEARMIEESRQKYTKILGADEMPEIP